MLPHRRNPLQSLSRLALQLTGTTCYSDPHFLWMETSLMLPRYLCSPGLVFALGLLAGFANAQTIDVKTSSTPLRIVTVAEGLSNPWGMAFLPDGRMLVTERSGTMRIVTPQGEKGPALAGLPDIISRGQGGLLDVVLAPDFATSDRIYFSYSEPDENNSKANSTAVAHALLKDDKLEQVTRIFS